MFEKGDVVLYGTNGICDITDISTVDIPGISKDRLYYILSARNSKCTIYVAADGDLTKMRKLISKDEATALVSRISDIEPLKLKDEKKPDAEYKEVLQKYDCDELLRLIKCIYFRRKQRLDEGKKVTAVDEKYMHLAEDVLHQEPLDVPHRRMRLPPVRLVLFLFTLVLRLFLFRFLFTHSHIGLLVIGAKLR